MSLSSCIFVSLCMFILLMYNNIMSPLCPPCLHVFLVCFVCLFCLVYSVHVCHHYVFKLQCVSAV